MSTENAPVALPGMANLRRLAVEFDCDPRSIVKALKGRDVRGMAGARASAAAKSWLAEMASVGAKSVIAAIGASGGVNE